MNLPAKHNQIKNALVTKQGYAVKDIEFKSSMGMYVGRVQDPESYLPDKWCTCTWDKLGKCGNKNRPDCDLNI